MTRKNQTATKACDATRKNTRTMIFATLRERIDAATVDLAKWTATNSERPYTTRNDCKTEYTRIIGMIDALEAIGGDTYGLWTAAQRALQAALPNCLDEKAIGL